MRGSVAGCVIACALLVQATEVARGQEASRDREIRGLYPVDDMIEQATNNIAQRYNLNKAQYDRTLKMMRDGVNRFLIEHQDEMFPLVRDLTRARFNGSNLSVEQRRRIGKAMQPLIDEARRTIEEANAEWRHLLSDEQKRLHDWDLHEMKGQFELIRKNADAMKRGEAVDNPIFPEPQIEKPEPPRPTKPPESLGNAQKVSPQPVIQERVGPNDPFDEVVEKFIRDYKLDTAQSEAARSIGREYKSYAEVYRKSHRTEIEAAEKKKEEARRSGDLKVVKETEAELDRLNARVQEWLIEMQARLSSIPTEAQRQTYREGKSGASATTGKTAKKGTDAAAADDAGRKQAPERKRSTPKRSSRTRSGKSD